MPLCRRFLPREVWDRPKHGFNVPLDIRLAGAWRPAVEAALDWGERHIDLFDYRYLWRLHRINIREGNISGELWNPFVLLAWAMAHSSNDWQLGTSEPCETTTSLSCRKASCMDKGEPETRQAALINPQLEFWRA